MKPVAHLRAITFCTSVFVAACTSAPPPPDSIDSGGTADSGPVVVDTGPIVDDQPASLDRVQPVDRPVAADDGAAPSDEPSVVDMPSGADVSMGTDVPSPPDSGPMMDAMVMDVVAARDVPAADTDSATDTGCVTGLSLCGAGACVNLNSDGNHCGACRNACTGGHVCVDGRCVCASGATMCGATCIDTNVDNANCGACNHPCATGQSCSSGHCVCMTSSLSACGAACVDVQTDSANCGTCGHACAVGVACVAGACLPCGGTVCSTACVSLSTSVSNCGTCGHACAANQVCGAGTCIGARVNAVHPWIVDGDSGTIRIEGAFGPTATVSFPGVAAPVTPDSLSPSRLEVAVPSGTTSGWITVSTLGTTTGALRFRRASFSLGVQPFRARYEQADYARQTPSLNTARVHAASVNTDRWLYLLGGANAAGAALSSVERAMINADGTLGAFINATSTPLNTSREGAAAVRLGNRVYVLGGERVGEAMATVEQATIGSDGLLSTFSASGSLRVARSGHVAEVIGGWVYVLGGDTDVVERAPIAGDGSLGAFVIVPGVTTRSHRRWATSQVVGSTVYLFGGMSGSTALATYESAPIDASADTIGNFTAASGTLAASRAGAASAVVGARLYVAGGTDGSAARSTVEAADIAPSGALRSFAPVSGVSLSAARHGASSTIAGNHWYLVGGATMAPVATIDRAEIDASGLFGTPVTAVGLAEPRDTGTAVAIGRNVFVLGGGDSPDVPSGPSSRRSIERSNIGADGSLGSFGVYDPTGYSDGLGFRLGAMVAVVGNYVHIVSGAGGDAQGAIQSLPIRDDGTIGPLSAFTPIGTSVAAGRLVVLDDRVCMFGGSSRSIGYSDGIYCSPIGAGGMLGPFAIQSVHLPTVRVYATAVLLGDYVWLVGGSNSDDSTDSIVYCSLSGSSISSCATYTGRLTRPRNTTSGMIVGGSLVVPSGNVSGMPAWTNVDRDAIVPPPGSGLRTPTLDTSLTLPNGVRFGSSLVIEDAAWLIGGGPNDTQLNTNSIRIPLR